MDGINVAYGVPMEGGGQSYPAIQASTYQPRTMSETVRLCLSEESFELLSEQAKVAIKPESIVSNFGGDDVAMIAITADIRFTILGKPRVFCLDKESGEVTPLRKGTRLAGTSKVTATKLIMTGVVDGALLEAIDGTPQIFTLKLTSNKTALIDGDRNNPKMRSLESLNTGLLKYYKQRRMWLGHLVSVALLVRPEKYTSKTSGQSSIGVRFEMMDGARPLPPELQQQTALLAQSEEVQELLRNPFNGGQQQEESAPVQENEVDSVVDDDYAAIPF